MHRIDMDGSSDRPSGAAHELAYWRDWLSHKGYGDRAEYDRMLSATSPFKLGEFLSPGQKTIRVLDVGAGPLTKVGKSLPGITINITAIDFLAPDYNALLAELEIDPPVRTEFGDAENLTASYPVDSFDLVVCTSALDHVSDPLRAIAEMLSVTRCGGTVFMVCQRCEGVRNNYEGMHQWNFDRDAGGKLILWNNRASYSVVERFITASTWQVRSDEKPDTTWIVMRATKEISGRVTAAASPAAFSLSRLSPSA